jgi:DNA-binding CsgD family transcriptional regulator
VLSDREAQVVRLLLAGERPPRIASQLYLSPSTVRNQLSSVYRKLGVSSQQELILLFRDGLCHCGRSQPALCPACRSSWRR